jgi:hypothetical protein
MGIDGHVVPKSAETPAPLDRTPDYAIEGPERLRIVGVSGHGIRVLAVLPCEERIIRRGTVNVIQRILRMRSDVVQGIMVSME